MGVLAEDVTLKADIKAQQQKRKNTNAPSSLEMIDDKSESVGQLSISNRPVTQTRQQRMQEGTSSPALFLGPIARGMNTLQENNIILIITAGAGTYKLRFQNVVRSF